MAEQTPAEKEAADKAAADKAAAEQAKKKKAGKVKYTGTSDVREIDEAAWKNIGIEQGKVTFDRSNNWTIDASEFGPDALEYFDKDDEGFTLVYED